MIRRNIFAIFVCCALFVCLVIPTSARYNCTQQHWGMHLDICPSQERTPGALWQLPKEKLGERMATSYAAPHSECIVFVDEESPSGDDCSQDAGRRHCRHSYVIVVSFASLLLATVAFAVVLSVASSQVRDVSRVRIVDEVALTLQSPHRDLGTVAENGNEMSAPSPVSAAGLAGTSVTHGSMSLAIYSSINKHSAPLSP